MSTEIQPPKPGGNKWPEFRIWGLHFAIAAAVISIIIIVAYFLSVYGMYVAKSWLQDIRERLSQRCYHYSYQIYDLATSPDITTSMGVTGTPVITTTPGVTTNLGFSESPGITTTLMITTKLGIRVSPNITESSGIITIANTLALPPFPALNEQPLMRRLREQCNLTRSMALLYLRMTIYQYVSYYTSLTMATVLAILAGIFLFSITKSGWQEADPAVVTIFLILAGAALFYSQQPTLFEYEKNIANYRKQFASYVQLEHRILRFMVLGSEMENDPNGHLEMVRLSQFVRDVDIQLAVTDQLQVLFNTEAVPSYTEFANQLNGSSAGAPAAGN